ncbi:MAG: DNA polymerase III subunit chi [Caldimonas sp.]
MTEISFYFNVADRVDYACRLSRKAQRQGVALSVTGSRETLSAFNRQLWAFAPAEFVPHTWTERQAEVPARLVDATVWLSVQPVDAPRHEALLNLGDGVPVGFETFARLYEVVSTSDTDRSAARSRWKAYADRGYAIRRHEIGSA